MVSTIINRWCTSNKGTITGAVLAANGLGGVVNNSRGILCAYKKNGGTYYDAARAACIAMQKDLSSVIGPMKK